VCPCDPAAVGLGTLEGAEVKPLYLHLCGEYFDQIKAGTKLEEFRLASTWTRRIGTQAFSKIVLLRGYPRNGDNSRRIERAWNSYRIKEITHPHFGPDPVLVLAIDVSKEVAS